MLKAKNKLIGKVKSKVVLKGKLNNAVVYVKPSLEDLTIIPTKEEQTFTHENSYGYDRVIVEPIPEIKLQDKEVTPTKETQTVTSDEGYDGLKQVTVNSIPDEYIVPSDSLEITENGTYNVKQYAEANVNIASSSEPIIEPDYITDGLVAWFDGEDDLDSSNHWVNRVGSDYIYQKSAKSGTASTNPFSLIKTKDAYKNNMMYGLITSQDYYIQGYTIEVVGKVNTVVTSETSSTSGSGATLLAFNKTASPMIQIYDTTGYFGCLNANPTENMPKLFKNCVGKRYKYTICLDEIQERSANSGYFTISYALNDSEWYTRTRTSVSSMYTNNGYLSILCYYQNSYFTSGEINCIRIYNRKLTEEELKHNYEIDKARFNLDEYTE